MELYDQHVHTYFSYDAKETFEAYLALNDKFFVTTEHFDLNNPVTSGDDVPDYKHYTKKIEELNKIYNHRLLKGIEIGYSPQDAARIHAYLKGKSFDVLLLSVHHNGTFDYMDKEVAQMEPSQVIPQYYTQMLEAVENIPQANIMAHFDYGVRVLDLDVQSFQELAEPYLIALFQKVIDYGLAFEINAKSIWKYGNLALYEYAVPLFLQLGGTKFSIGSDAHCVSDYENHFDEARALLHKNGVTHTLVYQNGQEIKVKI